MKFRLIPLCEDLSKVPAGCFPVDVELNQDQVDFVSERCPCDCLECKHYKDTGKLGYACTLPPLAISFV